MADTNVIEVDGKVIENLPNTLFRVELEDQERTVVLCHLAGKMRIHYIRLMPGDRVKVAITPYDKTKGRIVYRYRPGERPFRKPA